MADLTQEEAKALAERWMALPNFVWEVGMWAQCRGRGVLVVATDGAHTLLDSGDGSFYGWSGAESTNRWPDLRHAGTLGIAIAQLRTRPGLQFACTAGFMEGGMAPDGPVWSVYRDWAGGMAAQARTEAEAVVQALEANP